MVYVGKLKLNKKINSKITMYLDYLNHNNCQQHQWLIINKYSATLKETTCSPFC